MPHSKCLGHWSRKGALIPKGNSNPKKTRPCQETQEAEHPPDPLSWRSAQLSTLQFGVPKRCPLPCSRRPGVLPWVRGPLSTRRGVVLCKPIWNFCCHGCSKHFSPQGYVALSQILHGGHRVVFWSHSGPGMCLWQCNLWTPPWRPRPLGPQPPKQSCCGGLWWKFCFTISNLEKTKPLTNRSIRSNAARLCQFLSSHPPIKHTKIRLPMKKPICFLQALEKANSNAIPFLFFCSPWKTYPSSLPMFFFHGLEKTNSNTLPVSSNRRNRNEPTSPCESQKKTHKNHNSYGINPPFLCFFPWFFPCFRTGGSSHSIPFPPATAAAASLPPAAPARPEGRGPRGRRPPSELGVTPGPTGGREVFGFFQGAPVSCENAKLVSEKKNLQCHYRFCWWIYLSIVNGAYKSTNIGGGASTYNHI